MKKYIVLFAITVISFALSAQKKSDQEPYLTKSFSSETISSVISKTSGGNFTVTGVNHCNSAGKVNLRLPKNTGFNLKLSAMKISTSNLENFSGNNSEEEITRTVNGGGIPVTVDAGSGKINLTLD